MSDVTRILSDIEAGDPQAAARLLPLVYEELRKLAVPKLAQEKPGQTLQATALVHEADVRLVDAKKAQHWDSRGHFFVAVAEAVRRILFEKARRRSAKHGGRLRRINFEEAPSLAEKPADDLLALDEVLDQLAAEDPIKAELVKLGGFRRPDEARGSPGPGHFPGDGGALLDVCTLLAVCGADRSRPKPKPLKKIASD